MLYFIFRIYCHALYLQDICVTSSRDGGNAEQAGSSNCCADCNSLEPLKNTVSCSDDLENRPIDRMTDTQPTKDVVHLFDLSKLHDNR